MAKYKKVPTIVDAILWNGSSESDAQLGYMLDSGRHYSRRSESISDEYLVIHTPKGDMIAYHGDYIIRWPNGDVYPMKATEFENMYEPCD